MTGESPWARLWPHYARNPIDATRNTPTHMCLAIPGKVESISGDDLLTRMGRINFGGIIKEASLAYVPEVNIGDYVIVHVGFALSKVDEDEAHKVFSYLKQMEELDELKGNRWGEAPDEPPDGSQGRSHHSTQP